jgi:site-specific recombinase XerC
MTYPSCIDCGADLLPGKRVKGRCPRCNTREWLRLHPQPRRPPRVPPEKCIECGAAWVPRKSAKGRCQRCYGRHWRPRRPVHTCPGCNGLAPRGGRGLCGRCYAGVRPTRSVVCVDCGTTAAHQAQGRCQKCYTRWYNDRGHVCRTCGATTRTRHEGRCRRCFLEDNRWFEAQLGRVGSAGAKGCRTLVRGLFEHLRGQGFSASSRYQFVLKTVDFVVGTAAGTRAALVSTFEQRYRTLLQDAKRPAPWQRAFMRFLTQARRVARSPWEDIAQEGRTQALIAGAPPAFRPELEVFREDLVAERRYRAMNRERRRSLVSEHAGLLALLRCARWLAEQQALGWQQMTAERLRAFTRDCGGRSRFYAETLALLGRFFVVLVGAKRLFRNPLAGVRAPLPILPIEHVTIAQERDAWLRRLQATDTPAATRCVGLLTVLHGLLPAEIRLLRLGDPRTRSRTLWLRRSRSSIPLDPITAAALAAYIAERRRTRNPYLFVSDYSWRLDSPVSRSFVSNRLQEVGISGTTVARQNLIRDVLDRENPVIAARVLRLSIQRIHVYLRLFGKEKTLQVRIPRAASQDRLAI